MNDAQKEKSNTQAEQEKKCSYSDCPVVNIGYRTASFEGETNASGEYDFLAGESVTFFIGDLEFPAMKARGLLTLAGLAAESQENDVVANISSLLRLLDEDLNPNNGVTINDQARQAATQVDFNLPENEFESSPAVVNLVMNAGQDMAAACSDSSWYCQTTLVDVAINLEAAQQVVTGPFDPSDPTSYSKFVDVLIFDSLGKPHTMTLFFAKQGYDHNDPTTAPNHWMMYVQIGGWDVGDPDTSLPPPQNIEPAHATYNAYFNEDGSLNNLLTDDMLISNWLPRNANGEPNGALGPLTVLQGGTPIIPQPPISSNFVIRLNGSSQFSMAMSE